MSRGGDDVTTVVELREVSQDMLKMDDVKRDKTHVASSGQHMNKHDQWSIVVLIVLCKLPQASASFSFADFQGEGSSCLCFLFSFYGVGLNFLLPFSLSFACLLLWDPHRYGTGDSFGPHIWVTAILAQGAGVFFRDGPVFPRQLSLLPQALLVPYCGFHLRERFVM